MTLVSRANALASRLTGHAITSCCPGCFARFADTLVSADARELDDFRVTCHPFWNACMAVVITARSEDEVDALCRALCANLAACQRTHADAVGGAQTVHAFVDTACRCLQLVLAGEGDSASERAEHCRKPFATTRGFWPSSSAQLFPFGPLATLSPLIHWGIILPSFHPISVLSYLVRIARPFILDAVTHNPDLRASLVELITARLRGRSAGVAHLEERSPAWLAHLQGLLGVACLLHALEWGPDCGGDDLLSVLRGREADVFSAILGGLAFLDGINIANVEEAYKGLAQVANLLQQRLKRPIDILSARTLKYRTPQMLIPDVLSCFVLILELKCRRRCAGPGCGLFAHAVAPETAFKTCSGCKRLFYCSNECQRRDWTETADGRVPHKNVCAVIRKIGDSFHHAEAFASCTSSERKNILDFMMAHEALPWEYRERARELLRPHVTMGFFAVGAAGYTMHFNTFPNV